MTLNLSDPLVDDDDPWELVRPGTQLSEAISRPSVSYWRDVLRGFMRRTSAVVGVVLVILFTLFCVFGPMLSPYTYDDQELAFVNLPPVMEVAEIDGRFFYATQNLKVVEVDSSGHLLGSFSGGKDDPVKKRIVFSVDDGTEVVLNYRAKPAELLVNGATAASTSFMWNADHWLGTDGLGRDMATRLMFGMQISLLIAVIAMGVNLIVGVIYGGISGYRGGTPDTIMMRIVDIVSTIPLILYVILIQVLLQGSNGFLSIVIALGTVYWVDMARIVRGQVLSVKEQEFVGAAKTMGASNWRILTKHLIPHSMGSIVVTATMLIPAAIFIEAFMSFIGLGVAPPMASLGTMSSDALSTLRSSPYQLFIPATAICLLMFAFNFIGDGLRDALDPKQRR